MASQVGPLHKLPSLGDDLPEDTEAVRPLSSFPLCVVKTLQALSLTGDLKNSSVLGSGARRVVLYPSDYDVYAKFKAPKLGSSCKDPVASKQKAAEWGAKRFQQCIADFLSLPSCFLGDVKAGLLQDCRVLPWKAYLKDGSHVVGYDWKQAIDRLDEMHEKGLVTDDEARDALRLLEDAGPNPSPEQWFHMLDSIRFEVVRWSLDDIRRGSKQVRGDRTLTLAEAFLQSGLIKVDAVIFNTSNARFCDVSQIYEISTSRGEIVNNAAETSLPLQESIGMDVCKYSMKNKWMKVAKRMLSLATLHKKEKDEENLIAVTNSAAGLLYGVGADCACAEFLIEHKQHFDLLKLLIVVDAMISRIATAAAVLEQFPDLEAQTSKDIALVLKAKTHEQMLKPLEALSSALSKPVNESALEQLKAAHLFPVPRWALP